jgi:uncharacterized membrane protein SirB2
MNTLLMSTGALTGIKHTHMMFAFIFVLFFLLKAILLLTDKNETLDKLRNNKALKVGFDMVLPTIIIILGFTQAFIYNNWQPWLIIKIALVFSSIPMGIIAMRNKNKMLTIATCILFLSIIVLAYTN